MSRCYDEGVTPGGRGGHRHHRRAAATPSRSRRVTVSRGNTVTFVTIVSASQQVGSLNILPRQAGILNMQTREQIQNTTVTQFIHQNRTSYSSYTEIQGKQKLQIMLTI